MTSAALVLTSDDDDRGHAPPDGVEWPRTLALYVDTIAATLRRERIPSERASHLAECSTLELARVQGGRSSYLPTGERLRVAARNRRIYLEWRGNNYAELMAKYRIGTERRLQQIIAEQSAIQLRLIQPSLFDSP